MLSPRCNVIIQGIKPTSNREQTQIRFAKLFSLDHEKAKKILAGKRVTLRTKMDKNLAQKYVLCLEKMGVNAEIALLTDDNVLAESNLPSKNELLAKDDLLKNAAEKIKAAVQKQSSVRLQNSSVNSQNNAQHNTITKTYQSSNVTILPFKSRAIYYVDYGEESAEASSMHQPVDPYVSPKQKRKYSTVIFLVLLLAIVVINTQYKFLQKAVHVLKTDVLSATILKDTGKILQH